MFHYYNIGLQRFKTSDIKNFTSDFGLRFRRLINRPFRAVLNIATPGKIIVESYPKLKKGEAYIFAATHSFVDEITSLLSVIDRSVYTLMGSTNQLECNPKIYANWLNGLVYVDRHSEKSRKESMPKMERVLASGSSVLIFPEGGWNNTENLLVLKLFPGVYNLANKTGKKVVPIRCFREHGKKNIYVKALEPIDLAAYEKEEAMTFLRDQLATLVYEAIEQHATPICRDELPTNARELFMKERKDEYLKTKWTRDVWDEEITVYRDKNHPLPPEVHAAYDAVNVNHYNVHLIAPVWAERDDDIRHDFIRYMKENWNKKDDQSK